MANYLAQFQIIKSSCDRLIIAVEDVSDLWPSVKESFEERLPLKKAFLSNKTRNSVYVENLAAEFILTTDSRLRSRFPQELSVFWFREPYATVVLVTCEDIDEFKTILKPRLKLIVQNDEREWFIVFVSKAHHNNDQAMKMAKKIYARLEVDFNSKKRERCCKLDLQGPDANFWEELDCKMVESIKNTLDRRVQFYEEEIRKLTEQRFMPVWSFCNFFILKESLAFMLEMTHLYEDALCEYDELELCYLETVRTSKQRDFGGLERGDDQAALLNPGFKPLTQVVQDNSFREFEFRQYLFACQSKLLFKLFRPVEVASRGYSFIISFSKTLRLYENLLQFCFREVWVLNACLAIIRSTSSHFNISHATSDMGKEFFRFHGDLYSLGRVKFMRLAYLIGYGVEMERSPVNSASLSMLPWPKPAAWPLIPPDATTDVLEKEKMAIQSSSKVRHFNIERKPLPLEPSLLLREANRRRASLSVGNVFELFDGRSSITDGPGLDGHVQLSPVGKGHAGLMSRTYSAGPANSESAYISLDRPMRLSEIHVAAEHAMKRTISNPELLKSISSLLDFEKKYMELTKGAADNYHQSWWKRHGVVLDGEIASLYFKHGNCDLAVKLFEKICALYAGEGWQDLLAEVLPSLAECQKILNVQAGYLSSCIRLLSLDIGLFSDKERRAFQKEVVMIANGEMKHPTPLDVSSLVTFSGNSLPLELCDGDPGTLLVTVWSGFPDVISLESLSLTLMSTFSNDERVKDIKCLNGPVLNPGRNLLKLDLPPQKPGSYILGVLAGQIGQLGFRSHNFSKGGPPDSDDFMSYEKPTRPVLKVHKPRPLVDVTAAASSPLLINEAQWVGLIVSPLNYSLEGAILHIDTGPGLMIEESHMIEMEHFRNTNQIDDLSGLNIVKKDGFSNEICKKLPLNNGHLAFPDWAAVIPTVLWLPVRAVDNNLSQGTSSVNSSRHSIVDGMRMIALKLQFGVFHNQIFERTIAVHFTEPFHVTTHVADKCSDGTLLLQVIIHSQVKASLTLYDAWLDLQPGFVHVGQGDGRPTSSFFPFVVSPSSKAAILFVIRIGNVSSADETEDAKKDSILSFEYGIMGNRTVGAHIPVNLTPEGKGELQFKIKLVLQRPVLNPCLAVGFLSFPSDSLRVGQLVDMKWRLERLKDIEESTLSKDEVLYEVDANPDNWMLAGRKRGHASLPATQGSRVVITVSCLPLVSGYLHPPQLGLPGMAESFISCNPAGPHLVCVLPPILSSSFCVPA